MTSAIIALVADGRSQRRKQRAQLFYNDYEIEGLGTRKSEAAFALCKRLKEAGVPIDGVGFEMHVDPRNWPSADAIQKNFERYAALGLAIEITEMDVRWARSRATSTRS